MRAHVNMPAHRTHTHKDTHAYVYMSPDSGSLAPPNGMVPQAHALGKTGHGTIHTYIDT